MRACKGPWMTMQGRIQPEVEGGGGNLQSGRQKYSEK